MAVEFIRGYRCSDGTIFADEREADEYEAKHQFRQWCEANICRGGEWSASMIANAILEHWEIGQFKS